MRYPILKPGWFTLAPVAPIKVTSRFSALLRSPAARTLVILTVLLAPLTWFLYREFEEATNSTIRALYAVGVAAPACGIVVAVLSFIAFVIRRRRIVLEVGEQVTIPGTGVSFPLAELGTLQLFSKNGYSYMALLPVHVTERLTAQSARSGQHHVHGYIVEFPAQPTIHSFELADVIVAAHGDVRVEKIGAV